MENEKNVGDDTQVNVDTTTTDVDVNETKNEVNNVDTQSTDVDDTTKNSAVDEKDEKDIKNFNQEQVNQLVKSRIDRERMSVFKRYGVKDKDELDTLFKKALSYDEMKEQYDGLIESNNSLKREIAFIRQNIDQARIDDVLAYFKGKDLEFSEEKLGEELQTHPEWLKVVEKDDKPKTTIEVLGFEHKRNTIPESEDEKEKRIFGY